MLSQTLVRCGAGMKYHSYIGVKWLPWILGDAYLLSIKKTVDFYNKIPEKYVEADAEKDLSPLLVTVRKKKGKYCGTHSAL